MQHKQSSMQAKFCDLQPNLCDEQFPLQWQLTISMMAFGVGRLSVVCGTRSTLASLRNPFCNGSKNSCCAILACPHTLVWIWTRIMCCLMAPDVGGSLLLCHIFAQQVPSKIRNACCQSQCILGSKRHTQTKQAVAH